jgi:hypothetical protein
MCSKDSLMLLTADAQMLDELNVRCTAEGCGKVMQRGLLLSHSRTCQKAIMTCPDDECGLSVS